MSMPNKVITTDYTNENDFIIAPEEAVAISVIIGSDGVNAGSDGRYVIPQGTPLYVANGKSILTDRDEVMTVSSSNSAVLSGIARHEYDVTRGKVNGALLIEGYVDLYKLDSTTATAVSSVAANLPKITFMKGGKV